MNELSTETNAAVVEGSTPAVELTSKIVAAYVRNNAVSIEALSSLIKLVHGALVSSASPATLAAEPEMLVPFVSIKKSITPDYIVCLEDGKKMKMLKRHLNTTYGLSPDEYRAKWGLPSDYPMVAPNYAATRSALAKSIGLGQRPAPAAEPAVARKPGRPRKSAA